MAEDDSKKNEELQFNFLKDEPITRENSDFFRFYHDNFSPALKRIVENKTCVHTIGLFGQWGTGKSTIIDLLKSETNQKVFVFDLWKYQEDSLRRIFLIELVSFLKKQDIKIPDDILDPLYIEKTKETPVPKPEDTRKWHEKIWPCLKKNWLLMLLLTFALVWAVLEICYQEIPILKSISSIAKDLFSLTVVILILQPILVKILESSIGKIVSSILPWSKVKTEVQKEERLNSPEQFERLFKKVLAYVDERLIIVFDNIDRVQGDTAIKILATVKTFLDPTGKTDVTFIVPCDSDAIIQQIKTFYKDSEERKGFDPTEYLRKIFNVTIYTPQFIDTDLEEYTKKMLGKTGNISTLLLHEDVILVITKAFSNNPREIKQFINNLVAAIVIASETEVNDLLLQKDRISYLAKVLVLRQKFPEAYSRLKNKWYEPDNILEEGDPQELVDFIHNTSRITTEDAEPYIYFKNPSVVKNISEPLNLRTALVSPDEDEFGLLFESETNKDAVIDYVLLLMARYKNQHGPLLNIFTTQIRVFSEKKINILKKNYFDESAEILDTQLWQDFLELPTGIIFSYLLKSKLLSTPLRDKLIKRYLLSLATDEVRKPEVINFVVDLLKNVLTFESLFSKKDKRSIAKNIEEHYPNLPQVFGVFDKLKDQNIFITPKVFQNFIENMGNKNLDDQVQLLISYKEYITEHSLEESLFQRIEEWLDEETARASDYDSNKELFSTAINKLVASFQTNLSKLDETDRTKFASSIGKAISGITDQNDRRIFIRTLRFLYPKLSEPQVQEFKNHIIQFFKLSKLEAIKFVFSGWDNDFKPKFLAEYIDTLLPRLIGEVELLNFIHSTADSDQKASILSYLIKNAPDHGLTFIKSLEKPIQSRVTLLAVLLDKAATLTSPSQNDIYLYVGENLKIKDEISVKDKAVDQIITLLKEDAPAAQEVGLTFLKTGLFFTNENKVRIGKEVLEHLRQPGKSLTDQNSSSLNALTFLYKSLQPTTKNDYIYLLFGLIRQEHTDTSLRVFLQILIEIRPSFVEFEKDYKDLLERLRVWPDDSKKQEVLSELPNLKSVKIGKDEKAFWDSVEEINSTEE